METYVAKIDLPGGIKKGDFVMWKNAQTTSSELQKLKDVRMLDYNPANEPTFFVKCIKNQYEKDEILYIDKKIASKLKRFPNVNAPVKVVRWEQKYGRHLYYTVECDGNHFEVREDNLLRIKTYWFVSSKGCVASMPLTDEHMKTFEFRMRLFNKNVFNAKDQAQEHLSIIRNFVNG